jgi:hypothetical protein
MVSIKKEESTIKKSTLEEGVRRKKMGNKEKCEMKIVKTGKSGK